MNVRTQRACELAGAAFLLCRTAGAMQTDAVTRDVVFLWVQPGGSLSARLYTKGRRVILEVWQSRRLLAVSRVMGAPVCQVEEYTRGNVWERTLLRLAIEGAEQHVGATVH